MASMSSTIGEPFQLFLSSALSQKVHHADAVSCSYNRDLPGYATVTAQGDGIHVWDVSEKLKNLHAVASYSVGKYVGFTAPTFSLQITEGDGRSVMSYAILEHSPYLPKPQRGRIVWVIRQNISGTGVVANEKTTVTVDHSLTRICGTGHPALPLLLVSINATLCLADEHVNIKSHLDWPGDHKHLETFVFPRNSCNFIQDDAPPCGSVAITCCQDGTTLRVRLALLGEELLPMGTCEIPIPSSASAPDILGLTCSPSGILTIIDFRGTWATYQLASSSSSLVSTPISENLHLRRLFAFKNHKPPRSGFSIVSLGTSLVLLAALVEGSRDISLQVWDMSYGVLLTTQSMPMPSEFSFVRVRLTVADEGQVLLTLSPALHTEKMDDHKRSSIHVVPIEPRLRSNLAAALGKTTLTAQWLPSTPQKPDDSDSSKIMSDIRDALQTNNAQLAEQTFLKWADSHSAREAFLGYELVKKIFHIILPPESSTEYPYTPRITRYLLEYAVVSTIMHNGRFITALRQRGDWESVMLALKKIADISEDELMASARFLVDRQRKNEDAMTVDASEGYVPPLWTYLFACVSYPFSPAPMRLAIRKHLPDAQDLVLILEVLANWLQGGTEHEVEALLKSVATDTQTAASGADSPPYPKIIMFIQVLLDASFVALLQHPPSYDLLRRILSCIEPEIALVESLEPLHGLLEPFARALLTKEKMGATKETPAEWRKRKKQLQQQDGLSVGLYRLEELVI